MDTAFRLLDIEKVAKAVLLVEDDLKELESRLVVLKSGVARKTLSFEFVAKEIDTLLSIVRR